MVMKRKFKILLLVELLLGIALVLCFLGYQEVGEDIFLPNSIAWIPFTAYGLLMVGIVIEYVLGNKPVVRTTFLTIFILVGLICFSESYGFASIALSVSGIPYLIMLIVANIKGMPVEIQPKIDEDKVLPVGILSKKEIYVQYISWTCIIIFIVFLVVLLNVLEVNAWYSLIALPVILVPFLIVVYKTTPLISILKEINHNMDYESFECKVDEILKTNIHPETYNYLMIIKVNYLFSYDMDRALELFSTLKLPENKKYLPLYYSVKVEGLIHLGKFDEAYQAIQMLQDPLKIKFTHFYKVYCTTEQIENIEAIYPTNQKIKFSNASSLYTKMVYYQSRGNHEKAQEMAKTLIEYAPKLQFFKEEAEKIVKGLSND